MAKIRGILSWDRRWKGCLQSVEGLLSFGVEVDCAEDQMAVVFRRATSRSKARIFGSSQKNEEGRDDHASKYYGRGGSTL